MTSQAADGRRFKLRILHAAGWTMTGYVLGNVLRVATSLIMTRLLVPEMFGIMAVATVVQVVASMLSDVGLRQAVVRSPRGDQQIFLDTAWTLQIIRGGIIWAACAACAALVAWADGNGWFSPSSVYAADELPAIIAVSALSAVILGFSSTKVLTSDRHLNQRQVAIMELAAQVIGLAVAVAAGYLTRSIWSFVLASLISASVTVLLSHFYLAGPLNRIRIDGDCLLEMVRFGRWILVSSLFTVLAANGDRILLAAWIDPATLGLYILALNLVLMLEGGGFRLFGSVAMPVFSKIASERPEEVRTAYYRSRVHFDLLFVGSAGMLYGGGEALVHLLYDHRYAEAGAILQILSFSLLLSRFGLTSVLYLALGRPRDLGLINGSKTLALFTAVPLATWLFGIEGALWAIALHAIVTLPIIFILNSRHRLNNLRFEAAVLLFWPVGYGLGSAFSLLGQRFQHLL